MLVRLILVLMFASVMWSVEHERLTFRDGSTKTGYFDECRGSLTLDNGSTIAIRADDIARREVLAPTQKSLDNPLPMTPPAPEAQPEGGPANSHTAIDGLTLLKIHMADVSRARREWLEALRQHRADPNRLDHLLVAEIDLLRATLELQKARAKFVDLSRADRKSE